MNKVSNSNHPKATYIILQSLIIKNLNNLYAGYNVRINKTKADYFVNHNR